VKLVLADDNGDILLEAIQAEMIKHLPQTQQNGRRTHFIMPTLRTDAVAT
jgi:hypothetical protein